MLPAFLLTRELVLNLSINRLRRGFFFFFFLSFGNGISLHSYIFLQTFQDIRILPEI